MKPDADYIVESWKVDGQVIDSYSTSYEVTVKKNTEVSVQLVPASYKVTYKVNNEQGKLLVGKDTEEKTDGEISAAYGTSIKFTAVSNKFCHIKGWKLDGTEVTDTTKEKKTAYTDKKRTPGTVYRYLVKAYGVSLNKKVIYGQVSNCASAVTKPQTPKITSVKKAGTTKAAIQLKTERNVKGYQLYEYMWQTKKFKLVGKIEGKKYYKYDSKKKKFTRDRKSKVVQNAKKKTISVKITTNNVNFKRYRRYRFKVRSYVKYNGKQIFSKLSKQKIVTR